MVYLQMAICTLEILAEQGEQVIGETTSGNIHDSGLIHV